MELPPKPNQVGNDIFNMSGQGLLQAEQASSAGAGASSSTLLFGDAPSSTNKSHMRPIKEEQGLEEMD